MGLYYRASTAVALFAALALTALSALPAPAASPESFEMLGLVPASKLVPAPAFQLPTIDMGEVSLAEHRGHVVVLNFWTTW